MRIWDLKPGARVRIKRPFVDFDGLNIEPGEHQVETHDYFFYDDGHTLSFTDGLILRLAGVEPAHEPILHDAADFYWELVHED
ncbi:MAG: hypothetical protein CVU59_11155 [Deltaproteobacteria bacterium HGW-Deltaproteobacteria-17]|nr:MAG: hypothetical protein CVU59_11155 [Deltaproteobacteria bacterium HGW-Deltaproteobacteria-17]